MAIFISKKKEFSTEKPQHQVSLSDKYRSSLTNAYIFQDNRTLSLVRDDIVSETGITYDSEGMHVGGAAGDEIQLDSPIDVSSNEGTLIFRVKKGYTVAANKSEGVFSDMTNANWGENGLSFNIRGPDGGCLLVLGSAQTLTKTNEFGDLQYHDVIVLYSGGSTSQILIDGAELAYDRRDVSESTIPASSLNAKLGAYYTDATAYVSKISMPYLFAFNRRMGIREALEIQASPYQILKPKKTYIPISTAVPISATLSPLAIPTQETFGTPSLSAGAASITTTGINSTEAVGSLTTTTQAFITALGLATNEAFGNAALSAGGVNLQPPSLLSSESFGVASVVAGAVSILASGIGSAEALGMATVQTGTITLQLSAIGSGEALGVATIVPGPVSINPASLPTGEALGDLTLLNGGALVSLVSIGSVEAIGDQTISPGAVNIAPAGLNSAELLGTPQVVAGVYIVLPPSISSAEAHGDALVFNGSAIISPNGITGGEQLGPVTIVGGADVIGWLTAKIEARASLHAGIKTEPSLMAKPEVNRVN